MHASNGPTLTNRTLCLQIFALHMINIIVTFKLLFALWFGGATTNESTVLILTFNYGSDAFFQKIVQQRADLL
jgi:hypothetical protein